MVISSLAWILTFALIVPSGFFCLQCLAALAPLRRGRQRVSTDSPRPRIGVLIPAHDEEAVIRATLRSIRPQLLDSDRLLVVADNCSDPTADIAREEGAEVLERHDTERRGKGWALSVGRDHYAAEPPEVLVVVDADTTIEPEAFDRLAHRAAATGRPIQATYLMPRSEAGGLKDSISAFAWLVRNYVRPRGLHNMGAPCLLTGSGMAIPWRLAADAPLAGSEAGEDNRLSIDLALNGSPTLFCPEAVVRGELPTDERTATLQRRRWAHSTLDFLCRLVPKLLARVAQTGRLELAPLALEVAVPPLMMLAALNGLCLIVWIALAFAGFATAAQAWTLGSGIIAIIVAIAFAWMRFGRTELPPRALLATPAYVAAHGPHYLSFVVRRRTEWNKTPRERPSGIPRQ